MTERYIGEVRMFGGNYAPAGWALCDGQRIPIAGNEALFSLLSTTYGGDGQVDFGLPDLRGRVPVHRGSGRGMGNYVLGQAGGAETVTLSASHLPVHTHPLTATNDSANSQNPGGMVPARSSADVFTAQASPLAMNANAITATGQSQPHDNVQPFQCVNFIIALEGTFPTKD